MESGGQREKSVIVVECATGRHFRVLVRYECGLCMCPCSFPFSFNFTPAFSPFKSSDSCVCLSFRLILSFSFECSSIRVMHCKEKDCLCRREKGWVTVEIFYLAALRTTKEM